jgi:hypothetical protein
MCTVTFVRSNDKIIITSNRDEQVLRPNAIEPKKYTINNKDLFFPKDLKAGGTWYAVNENGAVLVLLNGANEKHQIRLNYRKSRGLIVLDIISNFSPINVWEEIDLDNIEPFTLVLFQDENLYQLRWNGTQKEKLTLDTNQNYIWSSTTLYPKEIREIRSRWFFDYMNTKKNFSENDMHNFHRYTENKNSENGLIINRNNSLKTLSITQTTIKNNEAKMRHYDLMNQKEFENTINFVENKTP